MKVKNEALKAEIEFLDFDSADDDSNQPMAVVRTKQGEEVVLTPFLQQRLCAAVALALPHPERPSTALVSSLFAAMALGSDEEFAERMGKVFEARRVLREAGQSQ